MEVPPKYACQLSWSDIFDAPANGVICSHCRGGLLEEFADPLLKTKLFVCDQCNSTGTAADMAVTADPSATTVNLHGTPVGATLPWSPAYLWRRKLLQTYADGGELESLFQKAPDTHIPGTITALWRGPALVGGWSASAECALKPKYSGSEVVYGQWPQRIRGTSPLVFLTIGETRCFQQVAKEWGTQHAVLFVSGPVELPANATIVAKEVPLWLWVPAVHAGAMIVTSRECPDYWSGSQRHSPAAWAGKLRAFAIPVDAQLRKTIEDTPITKAQLPRTLLRRVGVSDLPERRIFRGGSDASSFEILTDSIMSFSQQEVANFGAELVEIQIDSGTGDRNYRVITQSGMKSTECLVPGTQWNKKLFDALRTEMLANTSTSIWCTDAVEKNLANALTQTADPKITQIRKYPGIRGTTLHVPGWSLRRGSTPHATGIAGLPLPQPISELLGPSSMWAFAYVVASWIDRDVESPLILTGNASIRALLSQMCVTGDQGTNWPAIVDSPNQATLMQSCLGDNPRQLLIIENPLRAYVTHVATGFEAFTLDKNISPKAARQLPKFMSAILASRWQLLHGHQLPTEQLIDKVHTHTQQRYVLREYARAVSAKSRLQHICRSTLAPKCTQKTFNKGKVIAALNAKAKKEVPFAVTEADLEELAEDAGLDWSRRVLNLA